MTRKEVAEIIAQNPGKQLYLRYGEGGFVSMHEPISKTTALKNAKAIRSVRVSTFAAERPDLKRYLDEGRIINADSVIVTFDTRQEAASAV